MVLIVDAGVPVNTVTEGGQTALHLAALSSASRDTIGTGALTSKLYFPPEPWALLLVPISCLPVALLASKDVDPHKFKRIWIWIQVKKKLNADPDSDPHSGFLY